MLYNSLAFLSFLLITANIYTRTPARCKPAGLLLFSYVFYFTWSCTQAILLALLTLSTYLVSRFKEKSAFPIYATFSLLAVLAYFKYFNSLSHFFPFVHVIQLDFFSNNILPVGISYYIFKLISYTLDVHWGKIPAERCFISFAAYVSFFPQILSGPIQRCGDFLSQLQRPFNLSWLQTERGLRRILLGLFKKFLIADQLSNFVSPVFLSPQDYQSGLVLVAIYAFAIQLYADFSGIIDMAVGSGRLFGIESPENFKTPFFSQNIQAFWRNWHITLTTWLRDYLFTPLRMSLRSLRNIGLYVCIFFNMTAIGVWHGPKLTYLLFGLIHAFYVSVSVATLKFREDFFETRPLLGLIRKFTAPIITFHLVAMSFVFFKASDLKTAILVLDKASMPLIYLPSLFNNSDPKPFFGLTSLVAAETRPLWVILISISIMLIADWALSNQKAAAFFNRRSFWWRWQAYWLLLVMLLLFSTGGSNQFIYFKF
ncbi:MAG: hypothetical protein COW12_00850 [Candidatus Omnitrophica bacterium CG12_big_fil_rev_8_21_14_0_65_45_16]|nr:MAG: hypothetical protein COW12_00850 [Candidatus Omnitrophica bacterium CG12_big_fil_rev_8_21_14_0_65_45_16]